MSTIPARGSEVSAPGAGPAAERPRSVRLPRHARRKQLLLAAHEVFVAQGYHNTSMDDIAERAGVSKPVLYQHFPGKFELYLALLDQHTGALLEQVQQALATTTDNRARVAASVAAYFDFIDGGTEGNDDGGTDLADGEGAAGRGAYRLVFESDLRAEPAVRERVERNLGQISDAIARTIAEDTGATAAEAHLLSVGLAGMAEVGARWWLDSDPQLPKARAVELLVGLAWRGISGSPRRDV